jgi:hypothetical protein
MTPLEQKLQDLTRQYEDYRQLFDLVEKAGHDTSRYKRYLAIIADEFIKYDMIRAQASKEHEPK